MRYLICIVLGTTFALPAPGSLHRALLGIVVTPARVDLAESTAGRRSINLPSLKFPVRIEPMCPDVSELTSVSINVADSRFRYTPDDFAENPRLETTIVVPAPQIAPLTIEYGCPAEAAAAEAGIVIPDVLTAHAALRCSGTSGEQVLFEAIALGVELRCAQPQPAAGLSYLR